MRSPCPRRCAALAIAAIVATACGGNDQRQSDDGGAGGLHADSFVAQQSAIPAGRASGADTALLRVSPERRETTAQDAGVVIGGASSGLALTNDAVQPPGGVTRPAVVPVREPAPAAPSSNVVVASPAAAAPAPVPADEPASVPPRSGGLSGGGSGGSAHVVTPPTRPPVEPPSSPPQPAPETPVIIVNEPIAPAPTPTPTPPTTGTREPRTPRTPPVVTTPSPGVSDTAARPPCGGAGTSDTASRAPCGQPGTSDTAGAARRTRTRTGVSRGGAIIPLTPAAGTTTPATDKATEGAKARVPERATVPRRTIPVQGVRRP